MPQETRPERRVPEFVGIACLLCMNGWQSEAGHGPGDTENRSWTNSKTSSSTCLGDSWKPSLADSTKALVRLAITVNLQTGQTRLGRSSMTNSVRRSWIHWLVYRNPLAERFLWWVMRQFQFAMLSFYKHPDDVKAVRQVYREQEVLLQPLEAYALLVLARAQSRLEGDMAEVGMYRGASAKLICTGKGDRIFWGFDTFSGLADVGETDKHWGISYFRQNQYSASKSGVEQYLGGFEDIRIVAGYFPECATDIDENRFSFVHLDVDTYKSTLDSMRYFWPRLVPGGVIVTHDSHAEGVARAISEIVDETGARSIPLAGSQLMLVR